MRKFLHINKVTLFLMLLTGYLCHGGDVAPPQGQTVRNTEQPTRWERFTQHPLASHAPTVALGGLGAKLFQYGATTDSNWCKAASLVPLMAAPLWATYVQSMQRAAQRPLYDENALNEIKPRTSRWNLLLPALGTAGLVATLSTNSNSWFGRLLWAAGAAALPACYAGASSDKEFKEDIHHANDIIRWAATADFEKGVNNIESIRWALEALNDPLLVSDNQQEESLNQIRQKLSMSQADNLLKIQAALLKDPEANDVKRIDLLKSMIKVEKPYAFADAQEAENEIIRILEHFLNADATTVRNSHYERIEDALLWLSRNNNQPVLTDIFKQYPGMMLQVLQQFENRTKLYKDAQEDVSSREHVINSIRKAQEDARVSHIVQDLFEDSYKQYLKFSQQLNAGKAVAEHATFAADALKNRIKDVLESDIEWTNIHHTLSTLRSELTKQDSDFGRVAWFNSLITEIEKKQREHHDNR